MEVSLSNDSNCVIKNIELNVKNMKVGKNTLIENNGCSKLMTPNMARIRKHISCANYY